MLLRHATPRRNLESIRRHGLLLSKSKTKRPAVWLHTPGKSGWAVLHTVGRHGGRADSIVILELHVPRSWLRRSRRGLWWCPCDIPPERIEKLIVFAEMTGE
jgi:hypothetical protein